MSKVVSLHTEEQIVDHYFNSSESKARNDGSRKRMMAVIDNPEKSDRAKMEARMVIAIVNNDMEEAERIISILDRLTKFGISVVK